MNQIHLVCDPNFDAGLGHLSRLIAIGQELAQSEIHYCFSPSSPFTSVQTEFIVSSGLRPHCTCGGNSSLSIIDSYNSNILPKYNNGNSLKIVQFVDETTPLGASHAFIEVSPISSTKRYPMDIPVLYFKSNPLLRDEIYEIHNENRVQQRNDRDWVLLLGGIADFRYVEILSFIQIAVSEFIKDLTIATSSPTVISAAQEMGFTNFCFEQNISYICQNYRYVISAAGVTAWEFSFLRKPGFVLSVVENQEFQLNYLVDNHIRQGTSITSARLGDELAELIASVNTGTNVNPSDGGRKDCIHFLRQMSLIH